MDHDYKVSTVYIYQVNPVQSETVVPEIMWPSTHPLSTAQKNEGWVALQTPTDNGHLVCDSTDDMSFER